MSKYILREGFEHQSGQVFFTLALIDDAGRDIHFERLSVPVDANSAAVNTTIQTAVNRFPSVKVEGLISDAVAGLAS